jgi:hypothetical protein
MESNVKEIEKILASDGFSSEASAQPGDYTPVIFRPVGALGGLAYVAV